MGWAFGACCSYIILHGHFFGSINHLGLFYNEFCRIGQRSVSITDIFSFASHSALHM